jgi:Holliday junction DNA helicase RuvA
MTSNLCLKSDLVIRAIGNADVGFFEKIKGIGKKTAQRIIIDLKSKIGGLGELDLSKEENL